MTDVSPLQRLLNLYNYAAHTAARSHGSDRMTYNDLLDDLHSSIGECGVTEDHQGVVADLVARWRDEAGLAGSEHVATTLAAWADHLEVS